MNKPLENLWSFFGTNRAARPIFTGMNDPKYHAIDADTEAACKFIEDHLVGLHGYPNFIKFSAVHDKLGIDRLYNAFDHLMEKDFRDFPRK